MAESADTYTESDDLLPIGVAARELGVSVGTVRRWDRDGLITAVRTPGGQRRFRRSEVRRALTGGHTTEHQGRTTEAPTATR